MAMSLSWLPVWRKGLFCVIFSPVCNTASIIPKKPGKTMEKRKFFKEIDWSKTGAALKETLISIGQGTFLLRLRVDKLFPYIFVLFIIGCANIWLSYKVEQAALRVERNKKELETLKIYHAHLTGEIVELNRISTIEHMLEEMGSDVKIPDKPVDRIK